MGKWEFGRNWPLFLSLQVGKSERWRVGERRPRLTKWLWCDIMQIIRSKRSGFLMAQFSWGQTRKIEIIRGSVTIESRVDMVTSSEDSVSLPPYLAAKSPRLVAVGNAWINVQTTTTSDGNPRPNKMKWVMIGETVNWIAATINRRQRLRSLMILDCVVEKAWYLKVE